MEALVALIIRIVLSLAITVGIAVTGNSTPNVLEFLAFWILFYVLISVYYHARRIIREGDEEELRKNKGIKYRWVTPFEQNHPFFGLLFEYFILPVLFIIISFIAIPEGISRLFPETWREAVHVIIVLIESISVIGYDIWKVKEAYDTGELEFDTNSLGGILRSLIKPICIFAVLGILAFGAILLIDQATGNNKFTRNNSVPEEIREKFERPSNMVDTEETLTTSEKEFVEETMDTSALNNEYLETISDMESVIGSLGVMEINVATKDVRYVETDEVLLTAIYEMKKKETATESDFIPELYDEAILVIGKYLNELTGEEAYGYCVFFEPLKDEENLAFTWKSKYVRLENTEEQILYMIQNDAGYNFFPRHEF